MFASDLLENVPCPDSGICWRGFACKYNHDASVLQLQKALNILVSGENLRDSQIPTDTTDVDTKPANKKQRIDDADQELPSPSKESYTNTLPPPLPSIDPSFIEVPSDFYVPEYVGDAGDLEDLLKSSIDAVAKHLGSEDKPAPENNEPVDNSEYEPAFVTPVGGKRKTPTSVIKLRASIEDVGRQLSKITKADAKPRVGSLPTIADTEKQLQGSGGYNARKMMRDRVMKDVENENFRELGGEPAGGDATEEKRVKPTARVNSSKPIPSIQNKFLIKPPIQSNKPPISKPKQKKKEFLLNSDDEDEDEDDYEDDEDDEEEEKEPTKPKPTTKNLSNINKTLKPTTKSTSPPAKPLISGITKTPPKNITTNTKITTNINNRPITNINKVSPPKTTLPLAKNNATSTLKSISTNTTTATKQPEKPKTPGLLAMGVGLTKEQALAAQKLRVDSDKSFAGGLLSASEYPSILFELRPKVPRKVRQTYLDKFLIQFLTNFPENKAQAIEAAVKVESDIYSEAQTKMVYVNLCVHKMRTLFPSV